MEGTRSFTNYSDKPVCSEDCAFQAFGKYLSRIDQGRGVFLINESNVSVGVYGDREAEGFAISIAFRNINAGEWSMKDSMTPQAQMMDDRIKADLDRRGIPITEDSEVVV
jgi:hypothetical protein